MIAAMVVANSPWADAYASFWHTPIAIHVGSHALSLSLHAWINDALMAVFFLLVGLEIKRELVAGELSTPRQAALPIAGALGGMIVPAAIYVLITLGDAGREGLGHSDGHRHRLRARRAGARRHRGVPTGAKVFLTALAIVDDMGAVIVIALFYTAQVNWPALGAALGVYVVLIAFNRLNVRALTPYLALGVVLWFFVHESGVHATIAGVLLALTIPTRSRINALEFSEQARALIDEFDRTETGDLLVLTSKGQQEALFALERASDAVTEPLLRLEHALHSFAAFVVMPLFAIANAGVTIGGTYDVPAVGGRRTRPGTGKTSRDHAGELAGRQERSGAAASTRQLARAARVRVAGRDWVHDVDLHRDAGLRRHAAAGGGQGRSPGRVARRRLGGRVVDQTCTFRIQRTKAAAEV